MSWNPLRTFLSWKGEQRNLDRDLQREALGVLREVFASQRAQNEAFKTFLDGFKVTEPPILREYDEDAELTRLLAARKAAEMPSPDDFRALLAHLDS
jgi:hypothetical protein